MARKRVLHKQNQERRDAIAKLRNGESIEIWAHYECGSARVKVIPGDPDEQDLALVVCGGRLRVMLYINRDGWKFFDSYRTTFLPDKQVIGIVTEILEVKETPPNSPW